MMNKYFSLFSLASFFLYTAPCMAQEELNIQPPTDQGLTQTLIMVAIALAFFYLILWRPEQQRRKELENLRGQLKKGDEVVAMGIVGTVTKVEEDYVTLRMVDNNRIKFLRGAISEVRAGAESNEES